MHRAAIILSRLLGPAKDNRRAASSRALSNAEASALASALKDDARDYYYSACASVSTAISGLNAKLYTWCTVELYYAVFYALRAKLALNHIGIFYVSTSAFSIRASAGQTPVPLKENTHKSVLKTFEREFPGNVLLSQSIGTDNPLSWLMMRREEANYGTACFSDPVPPVHFNEVERYGLRRLITTYMDDDIDAYTFDPDHAMLAYPLRVIRHVTAEFKSSASLLSEIETKHIRTTCKDASGPLTQFISFMGK